jgi:hypothetical protein
MFREYDREKAALEEDLRIAQERSTEIYQDLQQQQQQPSGNNWPVIPIYIDNLSQLPPCLPSQSRQFALDPAGHPSLDFNYGIGEPVEPTLLPPFEDPTSQVIQPGLHPISAERDAPGPTLSKIEETGKDGADEELKPSKKRKTKLRLWQEVDPISGSS